VTITGVRNASALPVVTKNVKPIHLVVSHFSPTAASQDIKKSSEEQLKVSALTFTRPKIKFNPINDLFQPVTVAERSKACTVFARSEAGIVGSNPTQDMDV
jgi:hypothetical protein